MEKVSVILPTYNSEKYLCDAIESVLNQTYRDLELIIVNDGSTDGSELIIKAYQSKYSNIIYLKQTNKGHAGARNTGIQAATGTYIAFIDSDDIWLPEKLEEQIKEFALDSEVGFVHCNLYGFSEDKKPKVRGLPLTENQLKKYSGHIFEEYFFREIVITTTTVLIKKSCIDDVGMFDENLSRYGSEDRELFLRILWKYRAKYVNRPLALYRNRADSAGQNYEKMIKGQQYVYHKITKLFEMPYSAYRNVMSKVYQEWAKKFYSNGLFTNGLFNQIKAVGNNPIDLDAYLLLKRYFRYLIDR